MWVFGSFGESDSIETVFLSFIRWIFSCSMDCEREAKCSVKSLAFSRVYSTQEVWFFVVSYDQIRRRAWWYFGWLVSVQEVGSLHSSERDSKTFKLRCGRFICIWYKSVHRVVICQCRRGKYRGIRYQKFVIETFSCGPREDEWFWTKDWRSHRF